MEDYELIEKLGQLEKNRKKRFLKRLALFFFAAFALFGASLLYPALSRQLIFWKLEMSGVYDSSYGVFDFGKNCSLYIVDPDLRFHEVKSCTKVPLSYILDIGGKHGLYKIIYKKSDGNGGIIDVEI